MKEIRSEMAKLKKNVVCLTVLLLIVTSTLAVGQQNKKQSSRKRIDLAAKSRKIPQADAPLPLMKKKCMTDTYMSNNDIQ